MTQNNRAEVSDAGRLRQIADFYLSDAAHAANDVFAIAARIEALSTSPPEPASVVQVTEEMVTQLQSWICDDVLPAYGVDATVGRNDPELGEGCRAALESALSQSQPALQPVCATNGCGRPGSNYFERGGIGSHYCDDCHDHVLALAAPQPDTKASGVDAAHVSDEACDEQLAALPTEAGVEEPEIADLKHDIERAQNALTLEASARIEAEEASARLREALEEALRLAGIYGIGAADTQPLYDALNAAALSHIGEQG